MSRSDKDHETKNAFVCFVLGLQYWFGVDTSRLVSESTDREEVLSITTITKSNHQCDFMLYTCDKPSGLSSFL